MNVTFWGVRGSIPAPGPKTVKYGGNSSCVELRLSNNEIIIFDAGTGIRELGLKLLKEKKPLRIHLLLSHGHMDHVHGFPFFGPTYVKQNHITVAGCPRGGKQVKDMLKRQMGDIYFPVEYDGLPAKFDYIVYCKGQALKVGKSKIYTCETNHPGEGISFRVEEKGKSFVYMTDNELMDDRPKAFPFQNFVDFVKGADFLLCDTQYTPAEYKRTKGWGHPRHTDTARLVVEGGVKKVALFHHDPEHDDRKIDWMIKKTREEVKKLGGKTKVIGAREGLTVTV
ncbi:MAG: MBL fold metallo-hydrolase [bacterium]